MSSRKYPCKYCNTRLERKDLITHIERKHPEMIPENYSAARLVYNQINKVDHGKCRVCGRETSWNEKAGRYDVLCGDPKCKEKLREDYKRNMLRVRGTYNILNNPEQQKIMLANRRISGTYKFADGGLIQYTGSYEKKCLEFMDVVMQIPSKDILSPGPTMEYEFGGEKHIYIPDFYYIPYNLIIEVKDGGTNPNSKTSESMKASRQKTLEKEKIITNQGIYNYIRLTDNDFAQLIEVFMDIKEKLLEGDISKTYNINEAVSDYFENDKVSNPQDLYKYMIKNIKYKSNGEFKTPDNVFNNKNGDCHDQAYFAQQILNKLGYKTSRIFFIEYNENSEVGGKTHTALFYNDRNKWYWFETAWYEMQGIKQFNSINDGIKYIKDHWGFGNNYDKLENHVTTCKPPMTLAEYVEKSLS